MALTKLWAMSTNKPNRSYGQGAQGEIAPASKSKIGIWARLRYNFDNSIAKAGTFVLYVLLLMMVIALIMVGV